MKQSDAIETLERLMVAAQKARSNIEELNLGKVGEDLAPYSMGDLPLVNILNTILNRGSLTTMDFYNVMSLVRMAPEIEAVYIGMGNTDPLECPISLLVDGWQDE